MTEFAKPDERLVRSHCIVAFPGDGTWEPADAVLYLPFCSC